MPTRRGAFRIFRFLGIDVYLHWYWVVWAVIRIEFLHYHEYNSPIWFAIEYLGLFAIVLMHEFGHALACRQVGGQANQIILWPLGGVAYVSPPQRPGAQLWSIAAGPLVNVALFPIFSLFLVLQPFVGVARKSSGRESIFANHLADQCHPANLQFAARVSVGRRADSRSLLWYLFGRAKSLLIASIVGFAGVAGFGIVILLIWLGEGSRSGLWWWGVMDLFIALNCWRGLQQALALSRLEKAPRRAEFRCPMCHAPPPVGEFWGCGRCRKRFDTFATQGFCPHCNAEYNVTTCPFCHSSRPITEWRAFQMPFVPPQG